MRSLSRKNLGERYRTAEPSTFFEHGISCLLSGQPYEGLRAYAKALQVSLEEKDIEIALNSVDELTNHSQISGYEWVRRILLIGLAVKFPTTHCGDTAFEQLKKFTSINCQPLKEPIIIVAGGCSGEVEPQIRSYQRLILDSFRDFSGTIVSGGTTSGISGLIGEVQQKYPNFVRTVGYFPKSQKDLVDKRFCEIRFTESQNFSPIEPLQYWIDIIASGTKADSVKLLGINGGKISAIEYRMALAFGAKVVIIKGSGMEADKILLDKRWVKSKNLISITAKPNKLQKILQPKTELNLE
jgi:hypothetical protein